MFRALTAEADRDWIALSGTRFFQRGVGDGTIIGTRPAGDVAPPQGQWERILEHDLVPVVSYPYEWSFSMLRSAALLQLDLLAGALSEGLIIKDSTPFNIQFGDQSRSSLTLARSRSSNRAIFGWDIASFYSCSSIHSC